jgi:hypothetical protein
VLLDGRNLWKLHGRWLVFFAFATITATIWTILAARMNGRWPGGGSLSGLTLGTFAAAIFLFEMALAARKTKTFRTARWLGSAKAWMKAHIWLGLLTVPLVILHSGGRLGGVLSTILMVTFAIVIASGLWGVALQNILPRLLLAEIPTETVYSEIDRVAGEFADQARRLVRAACGSDPSSSTRSPRPEMAAVGPLIPGAPRPVGLQIERSPHPASGQRRPTPSPVLDEALQDDIAPYLESSTANSRLGNSREGQAWYFEDLRLRVVPELRPLVDQLEELCDRRRQLAVQARLHFWLHNWLWLHLPLSGALLILLGAHVVFALLYG